MVFPDAAGEEILSTFEEVHYFVVGLAIGVLLGIEYTRRYL